MIVDCVADLHGHYPELPGGDLLIVAGDFTAHDISREYIEFGLWVARQKYKKKVLVAGNHDNLIELTPGILQEIDPQKPCLPWSYLCDSGTEFQGLKIWGSPWTKLFKGMNPYCTAFTCETEEELIEKWELIPNDTDILITHSAPYGARDRAKRNNKLGFDCVGSKSLQTVSLKLDLKLWVVGHIHEDYGIEPPGGILGGINCKLINASHVNERYEPVNKPIRVEL